MLNRALPVLTREPIISWIKRIVRATPLNTTLKEKLLFLGKMGYWPNFENPKSYSEKINWRKLHSSNALYVKCSDKLAVRDHVREKIGEKYLIPVLYEGESITPEQLHALGDDIVVKANHDSGSVRIIRENTREEAETVCDWIRRKLETNYGASTNEWWYAKIPPRVYVERRLNNDDGSRVSDFKFFVFKRPDSESPRILIEVDFERGIPEHHRSFYDENRNLVDWAGEAIVIDDAPNHRTPFPEIDNYEEMLEAVLTLSEDFDHVRVDMYHSNGRNYFGELTFSEGGGRSRWSPREFDYELGEYWSLNREPGGAERPAGVEVLPQKFARETRTKAIYHGIRNFFSRCRDSLSAGFERFVRFLALPYALACLVEWKECKRNVFLVFWDHLYIFFVLKYFPDNYSACRLWEVDRKDWIYYFGYGYDPRSIRRRNRQIRREECSILFEDKEICYQLCRSHNLPLPTQYGAIGPEDDFAGTVRKIFDEHDAERLVIKLVDGCGGEGTCLVQKEAGELVVRRISDPLRAIDPEHFALPGRAVIQEWVRQHPVVSGLSHRSLNTIRMVTLLTPEKDVIVVGGYIRIGIGSNFLDSGNHGGVGVSVDVKTGRLGERSSDGFGRTIDFQPTAYESVSDVTLPYWDEVIALARRVQECFGPFNKFLGMDIGISETGPVLIEVNDIFDSRRFESVNGPLLKNEAVLDCCLKYGALTHDRLN